MEALDKFENEIEQFKKKFADFRTSKIVLYGTGRKAATLINADLDFCFIGLCDRDEAMIGKSRYGLPIISRERAEQYADILIICTTAGYWQTIYRRIRNWKLPIYFLDGTKAVLYEKRVNNSDLYWEKTEQQLLSKIETYEVVSFDVFDTLIMRKTSAPDDIFLFVENKLYDIYAKRYDFANYRVQAASELENPTLEEIYSRIKTITGWADHIIAKAKKLELEIEKELTISREGMTEVVKRAVIEKEVFFLSDMYLPASYIQKILCGFGIYPSIESILVSCEYHATKADGSLWEIYKRKIGEKRAIHIGDHLNGDDLIPRRYDISTYSIRNADDLMESSSFSESPDGNTVFSKIYIGMLKGKLFGNPFAFHLTRGQVRYKNMQQAGYLLFGAILYCFIDWMIRQARKDNIKTLLFFSRDGYLVKKVYDYYCTRHMCKNAPKSVYLETSRLCVMKAACQGEDDIKELTLFPFEGTMEDLLQERFHVNTESEELRRVEWQELKNDVDKLWELLHPYLPQIEDAIQRERKGYLKYIDSLKLKEQVGIFDLWYHGTTQYYFDKLRNMKTIGYYFFAYFEGDHKHSGENIMRACFQKDGETWQSTALTQNHAFLESFFTSPEGMLLYVSDTGKRHYAEKGKNQKYFQVRERMLEGVLDFFDEILKLQKAVGFKNIEGDPFFAEQIFSLIMNGGIEISQEMKDAFFYEDTMITKRESSIW